MKTVKIDDVYVYGETGKRALMTLDRFALEDFSPDSEKTFRAKSYDWPGDNEGRLILALVQLSQCTHKKSKYLADIMTALPNYLNDKSCFGEVLPDGCINEQQVAGTSWVLRSLIEYFKWKKDPQISDMIDRIISDYLFPLSDAIDSYPTMEMISEHEGFVEGRLIDSKFDKWLLSTDTGCLFIMIDGAASAYEMFRDDRIKHLIETMINKFSQIDVVKLGFQTHSTLSCLRGILKYYEISGKDQYLKMAKNIYSLYKQEGMTANYENYNWFNKPLWTEPCAIIDSFILALSLWKFTGLHKYLDDAHLIMYNGVYRVQRLNGGFGCDSCAGVGTDLIAPNDSYYEAWWCCSKRGGEFFYEAARHLYLYDDDLITVPIYENSSADLVFPEGDLTVLQTTSYPAEGYVQLFISRSEINAEKMIRFYVPHLVEPGSVRITVNEEPADHTINKGFAEIAIIPVRGTKVEMFFDISLKKIPAPGRFTLPGRFILMHGPVVLSVRGEAADLPISLEEAGELKYLGNAVYTDSSEIFYFKPSMQSTYLSKKEILAETEQITFA